MHLSVEQAEDIAAGAYVGYEEGMEHRWWREVFYTFERDGKFYQFMYKEPLTELQDDQERFDVDKDGNVECWEVEPYEFTETRYRKVAK